MAPRTVVTWCYLVVLLTQTVLACIPEMSVFRFGGCPNMTASYGQDISQASGRWYVLQTAFSGRPASCVRLDVQETYTASSRYELLYRYSQRSTDRVKALHVQQFNDTGRIVVQNTGVLGLFGRRLLVVDLSESAQLASVLSCQPLLVGHVISGQLWSRNATASDEGVELTSAVQRLTDRGVGARLLREVNQTGCPGYTNRRQSGQIRGMDRKQLEWF